MVPILFAVGYLNLDIVASVDRLPEPGGRLTARSLTRSFGGMSANVACTAARLGLSTYFFGRVGRDEAGSLALVELEQFGVDTRWVIHSYRPTTTALILVEPEGDRTIISEPTDFDYTPLQTALSQFPPPIYHSPFTIHYPLSTISLPPPRRLPPPLRPSPPANCPIQRLCHLG